MTEKEVTFEFVFEYEDDIVSEHTDEELEQMAWETFLQNLNDYRPQGTVKTIGEDD